MNNFLLDTNAVVCYIYNTMTDYWGDLVNYKKTKTMKAKITIELGNDAFGDTPAERLFEMQNVTERLIDRAGTMMAVDVGDFVTAQDANGNTVARMDIVED